MKGPEVRAVLLDRLSLIAGSPWCKVISEVGLPGSVVDVLAIDGGLRGYEIKGETDTLKRLPTQAESYNAVLQGVVLVGAPRHIRAARVMVPEWWGLTVAEGGTLHDERPWQTNPDWEAPSLLAMLWKPELALLMVRWVKPRGFSRLGHRALCEALAEAIPRHRLPGIVADVMLERTTWSQNRKNPA
jgi:hypothetical protein